jgi:hypothetical protein
MQKQCIFCEVENHILRIIHIIINNNIKYLFMKYRLMSTETYTGFRLGDLREKDHSDIGLCEIIILKCTIRK